MTENTRRGDGDMSDRNQPGPAIIAVPESARHIYMYPPGAGDWQIQHYAADDAGPYLVTFDREITTDDRARLLAGGTADRYPMIDDDSAVVRLTAAQRTALEASLGVAMLQEWQPAARVAKQLLENHDAGAVQRVQVDFFDDVDAATGQTIGGVLEKLGARDVRVSAGGARALLPWSVLDDVARISDVRWIEPAGTGEDGAPR